MEKYDDVKLTKRGKKTKKKANNHFSNWLFGVNIYEFKNQKTKKAYLERRSEKRKKLLGKKVSTRIKKKG